MEKMSRQDQEDFLDNNLISGVIKKVSQPDFFDEDILLRWLFAKRRKLLSVQIENFPTKVRAMYELIKNPKTFDYCLKIVKEFDIEFDQSKKVQALLKLFKD